MISDFSQVPMGTVVAFILNDSLIPNGWLKCDGREIPGKYPALINALGSNRTPNLAGRTFVGSGTSNDSTQSDGTIPNFGGNNNWALGKTGGEFRHRLNLNEMPNHSHYINGGNFGIHHRSFDGAGGSGSPFRTDPDVSNSDRLIRGTETSGGNDFHNTMQPYYVINYIIYAGHE